MSELASGMARRLGISEVAASLFLASDVVDMHVDTFIWQRLFGYDLARRHGMGPLRARYFGQADLPRAIEAGVSGAQWVITTHPWRSSRGRRAAFFENLAELRATLSRAAGVRFVRNSSEYRAARAAGQHAAFIAVQGGNALDHDLDDFDRLDDALLRVTLLHFTRSRIGVGVVPSWLRAGDQHLTDFGRDYVRKLNEKRIFVDLAHLTPEGFFDALEVHDKRIPLLVTHTAANAVYRHFRNLDDAQIRAVADTGGLVGIFMQGLFLGPGRVTVETAAEHVLHLLRVGGEDHVGIGTDFDGAILPPRDLRTLLELPRLVEALLKRRVSEVVVQKVLGLNFLRALTALRG